MKKSDLQELIVNGEDSGVEFKRDDVRPEQVAKEIVALANFQGGRLLIGVEDDGTVTGVKREDIEEWLMDVVFRRYVHPMILPFYEEVVFEDGRRVAVVTIQSGVAKPYVVRHNDGEDIYVRVGSTSRPATREQQARLFAAGAMLHPETLPVSGTALSDLSLERLGEYLLEFLEDGALPKSEKDWEKRLVGLGLMTQAPDGMVVASIAGLILFGRSPRRALPQAGIRWMAFAGEQKDYQALDDEIFDGPLVARTVAKPSGETEREPGLLERVVERMARFISSESGKVDENIRRERVWHYPIEAIREALVNAVVHRDWTRSVEVEVVAYRDRLQITSPGALQNSMTIEKMLAGQRSPRNPLLVDIMRDHGYVDARGMGVRNKIVPLVREFSGADAVFTATEDFVGVTIPKRRLDAERTGD